MRDLRGSGMSDEPSTPDPVDVPRKGLDRRTLIKASAAAGAVAWTAPVLIDSLSSPAAAASPSCTVSASRWGWAKTNGGAATLAISTSTTTTGSGNSNSGAAGSAGSGTLVTTATTQL